MFFDGITLGPYDVLFVKLKQLMVEGRTAGTTNALRYGNWMSAAVSAWSSMPDVGLRVSCVTVGLALCPPVCSCAGL